MAGMIIGAYALLIAVGTVLLVASLWMVGDKDDNPFVQDGAGLVWAKAAALVTVVELLAQIRLGIVIGLVVWFVGIMALLGRPVGQASLIALTAWVPMTLLSLAVSQLGGGHPDSGDITAWENRPAPELTIDRLDGPPIRLSEQRGRRVILDFWATWCPPCREEIPSFERLTREIPDRQLLVVGISSEDPATLRSFVDQQGIHYPIGTCRDLPPPFSQVVGIPTTFVIDRTGVIRQVLAGYQSYDELKAEATGSSGVRARFPVRRANDRAAPGHEPEPLGSLAIELDRIEVITPGQLLGRPGRDAGLLGH